MNKKLLRLNSLQWWPSLQAVFMTLLFLLLAAPIHAQQRKSAAPPTLEQLTTDYELAHGEKKRSLGIQIVQQMIDEDMFFTPPPPVSSDMPKDTVNAIIYYTLHCYAFSHASDTTQIPLCISYADKCMPLLRDKHKHLYANVMGNLARLYLNNRIDRQQTINWAEKTVALCRETGNYREMSRAYATLSFVFTSMKNGQQAIDYIMEAINASRKSGDTLIIHTFFDAASEGYVVLGQYDKAIDYGWMAVNASKNRESRPYIIAGHYTELGYAYYKADSLRAAEKAIDEAFRLFEKDEAPAFLVVAHQVKGLVLMKQHRNDEAAGHFRKACDIAEQLDMTSDVYNLQFNLYEALRDSHPREAMKALETHLHMRDSLYNEELKTRLSEAEASFHNDQLKKDNEAAKRRMRSMVITAIVVALLLAAVIAALVYAMRTRAKTIKTIKRLQRAREQFFTNVTHELRTPLTVIIGMADQLRKTTEAALPTENDGRRDRQVKAFESIGRNGQQLLTLINQLLDVAKVTSEITLPQFRQGNLVAYVGMTVEGFRETARSKNIRLTFVPPANEPDIETAFVPDYMQKILSNLLANALKFTGENGQVAVRMTHHDGRVTLSVSDTGQGITEEDLPHVFEPFYCGAHSQAGTGVGLSLVRQLTEALKGTVSVESRVGEGTTFTVNLPVKVMTATQKQVEVTVAPQKQAKVTAEPQKQVEVTAEAPDETGKPIILVVEDNADMAQYIGSVLADSYEVRYAADGAEGMRMTQELMPDLVVTDIMMPDVDGLELCHRIRASEMTNHIPLVIVTAKVTDKDRMEGIRVGADAYLNKPFLAEELLLRIEKLLESRRMLQRKFSAALKEGPVTENVKMPEAKTLFEQNLTVANEQFLHKLDGIILRLMSEGACTVANVAEELCMSRSQFDRKLKAVADITPSEYIIAMRLNEVKRMLTEQPALTLLDIALRTGFSDNAHMTHAFKRKYGISPSQYLRQTPADAEE